MRIAWVVFLAGLCVGCTSTRSKRVGDKVYPPKPDDFEVAVYQTKRKKDTLEQEFGGPYPLMEEIRGPFFVIGKIDAGGAPAASETRIVRNAQKRARELGADAIILTSFGYWTRRRDGFSQPVVEADAVRFGKDK